MSVPFKKDPVEFNGRKLMAENVFDLLPKDHDCFIYEDIFAQIDTKSIEEKYSMAGQHAYHPKRVTAILIYAYSQGIFGPRQIEKKCKKDLSFMYISHRNCPNFRVLADFRKDNYEFFVECFKKSVKNGKKQISYADAQAKIMKSRGSFEYCYNGQILVDSKNQIIVEQHLTRNANDKNELKKALTEIEKNTSKTPEKVSADSGYRSSDNISAIQNAKIDGYIATGKGEKDSSHDTDKKIGKSQFSYDSKKDIFICPAGHRLQLKSIGKKRVHKADDKICEGCSFKNKCTVSSDGTATIYTDKSGIILTAMVEKMEKDSSKKIYRKRKIIVEPVFGQIKTGGFKRFSLRGIKKVGGEFSLVCAVSNFKKIVNMIKAQTSCPKERELLLQAI